MPPVKLAGDVASGDTAFRARPSNGPYRFEVGAAAPISQGADLYALTLTPSGLTLVDARSVLRGDVAIVLGREQLVDYAEKARQRIAELRNSPNPWAEEAPITSLEAHGQVVWEPTAVVSMNAEAAAIAVFSFFALQPPPSAVAIFPREDGGLRLQAVGEERAVIVDIATGGDEFVGEYAGDDVYHTETMRNADDAARFITDSTR